MTECSECLAVTCVVLATMMCGSAAAHDTSEADVSVATVYVATWGDDTQAGTREAPWRTLQHAVDTMPVGGTCYVYGGVYRETVTITKDNITLQPLCGDLVQISGADVVTGWTRYNDKIYQTPFAGASTKFTQVFADGQFQQMARWPDNVDGDMMDVLDEQSGYAPCNVPANRSTLRPVEFPSLPAKPDNYWAGGYFRGITGNTWSNPMGTIRESSGTTLRVEPYSSGWKRNSRHTMGPGWGYLLHLNALDREGEWYHEGDTLYFYPPEGTDIETMTIEAKVREWAVVLNGCRGVTLQGLNLKAASLKVDNADDCTIRRCSVHYLHPFIWRTGYASSYTELGGIYLNKADRNLFTECYVAHSWGHGFSIASGSDNRIEHCIIEDVGWTGMFTSSVVNGGHNLVIDHTTLGSTGRFHVRMHDKTSLTYCDLYDCMKMGQDAGSIQAVDTGLRDARDMDGAVYAWNTLHDCNTLPSTTSRKQFVVAFYMEGAENYTAHHNVVWNFKTDILDDGSFCYLGPRDHTISNVKYYHNTVWNMDKRVRIWNRNGGGIDTMLFKNNIFQAELTDKFGEPSLAGGIIFENNVRPALADQASQFVDAAKGDFRLKANSTAVDAGEIVAGISGNPAGAAPDAGALEYGQPMWATGAAIDRPVFDGPSRQDALRAGRSFQGCSMNYQGMEQDQ